MKENIIKYFDCKEKTRIEFSNMLIKSILIYLILALISLVKLNLVIETFIMGIVAVYPFFLLPLFYGRIKDLEYFRKKKVIWIGFILFVVQVVYYLIQLPNPNRFHTLFFLLTPRAINLDFLLVLIVLPGFLPLVFLKGKKEEVSSTLAMQKINILYKIIRLSCYLILVLIPIVALRGIYPLLGWLATIMFFNPLGFFLAILMGFWRVVLISIVFIVYSNILLKYTVKSLEAEKIK